MAVDSGVSVGVADAVRNSIRDARTSIASVFRNPALRRMQLALAGSMIGDWAYSTAVIVWAYGVGGAKAVGVWGAIRFLLMAVTSPLGSALADRLPRKKVLIASDLLRALVVVAATACLVLDTPAWPIYVLATAASLIGCVFRPAQMSWMPSLTNRPEELTASNGTSSTIESIAFFVGPAIGASLIALTNIETVFLLNAATFLWSAFLVLGIHPHSSVVASTVARAEADTDGGPDSSDGGVGVVGGGGAGDGDDAKPGMLAEMAAGFSTIAKNRDLLMVAIIVCAQTVVAGATLVFTVIFAVDIVKTGPEGVGFIDSVFGVGAIVGGFYAIARASHNKLAGDMATGTILWAIPLLLVVVWPSPVTVFASAIIMGFGNPLVDVNFATIVQRITPDAVLGRVFGAYEGALIGTMALGSAVMPFLISWVGLRPGLALLAVLVAAPAIGFLPRCRRLDATLIEPEDAKLLRGIPMFSPLTRATLELLATQLTSESAPAGRTVVREGEESDRFLVIKSGAVEVSQNGMFLRIERAGDYFGEIGLLRDVPRTATVTATEDTELLSLSRADFLDAVSGSEESRVAADDIISRRMG
ncbi:MFS transporter [Pedococcus bigeumensis]|uniref:MFS transporter n=1 Tax=Pedococcus bigeumensis TaxID=433644 RepID=A0A502CIU8_9MICO|nr:MFS transporter [Pedococcus bigeumensis]TPG12878.1 MFS transporter [Pedococcus bigeumensis]